MSTWGAILNRWEKLYLCQSFIIVKWRHRLPVRWFKRNGFQCQRSISFKYCWTFSDMSGCTVNILFENWKKSYLGCHTRKIRASKISQKWPKRSKLAFLVLNWSKMTNAVEINVFHLILVENGQNGRNRRFASRIGQKWPSRSKLTFSV